MNIMPGIRKALIFPVHSLVASIASRTRLRKKGIADLQIEREL